MCDISSKLTIKTPERRHWLCSGVFIVNFEHISHLFLNVDFEQVNVAGYCYYSIFCCSNPIRKLFINVINTFDSFIMIKHLCFLMVILYFNF